MTPEKQRIAIAEACGAYWTTTRNGFGYPVHLLVMEGYRPPNSWDDAPGMPAKAEPRLIGYNIPDYLNELNAINSAVLSRLNGPAPDGWNFIDNLRIACRIPHSSPCMALVCATAAQRAEAFLRTIGKWEDEQ